MQRLKSKQPSVCLGINQSMKKCGAMPLLKSNGMDVWKNAQTILSLTEPTTRGAIEAFPGESVRTLKEETADSHIFSGI